MFFSKVFLVALTLMGSVTATALAKRVLAGNQACHTKYCFIFTAYDVLIGVPYTGSAQCDKTFNAIRYGAGTFSNGAANEGTLLTWWHCVEEDGFVHLWFHTDIGDEEIVNTALAATYPNVNGGFNC